MGVKTVILFLTVFSTFKENFVNAQGKFVNHYPQQGLEHRNGRNHVTQVYAMLKGTAYLPCDLTAPMSNDSVILIVWYKNQHTPIYSFDARGSLTEQATHWHDASILEDRANYRTYPEPSVLSIDNVSEADEGEYRCRIDFHRSPTKNIRVRLQVIIPPQKPTIIDEKGKEVSSRAGPYVEGGEMILACFVTGGKPEPSVKWWRGETLIDSTETKSGFPNVKANQLTVRNLQRSDQHATFTCQASNTNITAPTSTSTTIEIYFRPLTVEIMANNHPLSADRKYEIPCQSIGSRPAARISWWMDNQELLNHTQQDSSDGNITTSILILMPLKTDNGKSLTCRANNDLVQGGVEEATIKLNVFYVPELHLALGSNLNPDDIEEGDDVYFECKVNANPWAYKVIWKHNGQVMQHSQKAGVIMSTSALALQGVTRQQAGNYTCIASNVEGDGDSNTVQLKIMYKPLCRIDQKRVYGVAKNELAKVLCEVDSYPPPLGFKWYFNNSVDNHDIEPNRYKTESDHQKSLLSYTPVTERDYGALYCWAENTAGRQVDPCVYHLIAAGKPDPPYNCTLLNQTTESLEVECVEGFDGGQPQYFSLEVYDQQTNVMQVNLSAKFPMFTVSGLESGKILRLHIYARNSKGKSEPVILEGFTLKVAEKQTETLMIGPQARFEVAPLLGILVGIIAALFIVTILIVAAMRVKSSNRRDGSQANRPGILQIKDKVTLPLRSESEDLFEKDDKNPDVIPANKDSDYQLGSAAQTPGLNNSVHAVDFGNGGAQNLQSTPLAEAFISRSPQGYAAQPVQSEVTYAELCLARPNSLDTASIQKGQYTRCRDEPTIYAQIDHGRRPPPPPPSVTGAPGIIKGPSPIVSPVSQLFPATKPSSIYHREVVTVRTPLMSQQESCV